MSDNAIVLISGKQGSGKSSHARAIVNELTNRGYVVFPMKFASTLYEIHDDVRRILREKGIDNLKGIDGPLLQLLGTEWGRKTRGEDIWVDAAKNDVDKYTMRINGAGKKPVFVFDDCRFPNELFAWGRGIFRIKMVAPENVRCERAEKWREATDHPSEIGLDQVEACHYNLIADTTEEKDIVRGIVLGEVVRFCNRTIGLP